MRPGTTLATRVTRHCWSTIRDRRVGEVPRCKEMGKHPSPSPYRSTIESAHNAWGGRKTIPLNMPYQAWSQSFESSIPSFRPTALLHSRKNRFARIVSPLPCAQQELDGSNSPGTLIAFLVLIVFPLSSLIPLPLYSESPFSSLPKTPPHDTHSHA